MSISGICRELKKEGLDQHRLIVTGYLRALHDMGLLQEENIPPSKVYSLNSQRSRKIYSLVGDKLRGLTPEEKFAVGVCTFYKLFNRPCFKRELELTGIVPVNTSFVRESRHPKLEMYREALEGLVPPGDPGYEPQEPDENISRLSENIVFSILRQLLALDTPKPTPYQTKLTPSD